jgi:hypothetical protein
MTYAPDDLLAVVRYLNAQGAPWESLGIVGDTAHLATGGYHVGRDDLAAYGRLGYDYSVVESPRDANPTDAASAVDFAGTSWWRPLTLWLVDAARAGAPGTECVREIIYTPDGQTVRRWDALGIRDTGDDSHLWHTHISFFRDSEGTVQRVAFQALLARFFTGLPANTPTEIDVNDLVALRLEIPPTNVTGSFPITPKVGTHYAYDNVFLSIQNDTYDITHPDKPGVAYRLRVFEADGSGGWAPWRDIPRGLVTLKSGERLALPLRDETSALSIIRLPLDDGTTYAGTLGAFVGFERT